MPKIKFKRLNAIQLGFEIVEKETGKEEHYVATLGLTADTDMYSTKNLAETRKAIRDRILVVMPGIVENFILNVQKEITGQSEQYDVLKAEKAMKKAAVLAEKEA